MIKHILFVCTGNSCRSIMAEAYAENRFKEENINIEVRSAGTIGIDGNPPTRETLKVLEEEAIEDGKYKSKLLTKDLINWADLVLVMSCAHKERIKNMVPDAFEKTKCLAEFGMERLDHEIPDPIGMPLEVYEETFALIRDAVEGLIDWLIENRFPLSRE